ncbi:MAG: phosphotriesterase [Microscillaceae bacterium]|nr:phosphotriesterase [Microscillaceae bacterium]
MLPKISIGIFIIGLLSQNLQGQDIILTVQGPIPASELGTTLIHEHILVDFIGADQTGYHRWDKKKVMQKVLPYLQEAQKLGVKSIFECTPAFLGRDPMLLYELSLKTGIRIITNTGYYGARDNQHLPPHAFAETAAQLAERWTEEFKNGIEDTDVRPGFIKIGVNSDSLSEMHAKLVRAAALCHLKTGLSIACHTGPALPLFQEIEILKSEGVSPEALIWVHAQAEKDLQKHVQAAQKGVWISLDGLGYNSTQQHFEMIKNLKNHQLLHKVLISHDAGWYRPGEENGGQFTPYTAIFTELIPLMKENGFTEEEIQQLLVLNPQKAFTVKIRSLKN